MSGPFRPEPRDATVMRHQVLHCLGCGGTVDAVFRDRDEPLTEPPEDGDFSICVKCGEVSVYAVGVFGVALRPATTDELADFASNPANTDMVRRVHMTPATRPRNSR